jgi:type VI secretion system protein ImpD
MGVSAFESILAATVVDLRGARLGRFLALAPEEALIEWLGLEPGEPLPARKEIIGRLERDIAALDELISLQLDVILHDARFQALESAWRGLALLTEQSELGDGCVKVRVLDVTWKELTRDTERAIEFDQSQTFQKVYSAEFDTPGGEPFGVLLGDYSVRHRRSTDHPEDDIGTLRAISRVAAAAFAPFVASAHPSLFGLESWRELERPLDLGRTFRNEEYAQWNRLRREEDIRFVGLVLPRTLLRRPWREDASRADGFRFAEDTTEHSSYLWGSSIYAFGEVLIRTFIENGWMASIRGVNRDTLSGGLVTSLPDDWFTTDVPGLVSKGALEVQLTDDQEKALGDFGFIPLTHCHGTSLAAFYGSQSLQAWDDPQVSARERSVVEINMKLSSMLQYMFCVSRFAHYVKVICRDKLGSYTQAGDIERHLNDWLIRYATSHEESSAEIQAKYPLRDARVEVREVAGRPGVFQSIIHLQPHYQLDQMTSAVRLVTEITSVHSL